MKKLLIIFTASILGMVACNEERVDYFSVLNSINISNISPNRILLNQEIENIAEEHNQHLISVLSAYNFECQSHSDEMFNQFYQIGINLGLNQTEINESLLSYEGDNSFLLANISNSEFHRIKNEIFDYVAANPTCSYQSIINIVSDKKIDATSNLVGSDLDFCLIFLETFEKSSHLWMSVSQGGLGYGDIFIDNLGEDFIPPVSINWGLIAFADGAAAARSLFKCWAAAGFGPIGWGAVVGCIGWSTAYSSGAALLGQLIYG